MKYGETIKRARRSAGLTQQDLADKLQLTRNYIALIETNKRVPSSNNLMRICGILKINGDEFIQQEQLRNDIKTILGNHKIYNVYEEIKDIIKRDQRKKSKKHKNDETLI